MKPRIAFLTGGYSGEAEVSYASAKTILKNIDTAKFEFYTIDITPEGWFYTNKDQKKTEVNKYDFSITESDKIIKFDAAFIGIHGTPGEDGKLQGYLDMAGIPYTSCNTAVSAVTFNKAFTKAIAAAIDISVARSILLYKEEQMTSDRLFEIKKLKLPLFIKPNNGGSSIGISKISKREEVSEAVKKAFEVDDQILIEEAVAGREFTVGVYKIKGKVTALPVTEILPKKEFFDFEAKYHDQVQEVTPANIEVSLKTLIQNTAVKLFKTLNCSGVIRIDFIYSTNERKLYMLEINTVPGQSEKSLIPQQILVAGGNLKDFYTGLIEEALKKKV